MKIHILNFCIILGLTGCASIGVEIAKPVPPRPEDCKIDIIPESENKRPFEVLCAIDSKTAAIGVGTNTIERAITPAKIHACRCGADALIITGGKVDTSTFGRASVQLKAVRFK